MVPLVLHDGLSRKLKPEPDDFGGCASTFAAKLRRAAQRIFEKHKEKHQTSRSFRPHAQKTQENPGPIVSREIWALGGVAQILCVCLELCS